MEQQTLVMGIILLAAVAADKAGTVMTDGQFRHQNLNFLTGTKCTFTEPEQIGELFPSGLGIGFQLRSSGFNGCFQRIQAIITCRAFSMSERSDHPRAVAKRLPSTVVSMV